MLKIHTLDSKHSTHLYDLDILKQRNVKGGFDLGGSVFNPSGSSWNPIGYPKEPQRDPKPSDPTVFNPSPDFLERYNFGLETGSFFD